MKKIVICLVMFLVLNMVIFVVPVESANRAVGGILYVPDQYSTIQGAIDAAGNGCTIIVRRGVYTGEWNKNITFHGKGITVQSEEGPEETIIDCEDPEDPGRGFIFNSGEDSASQLIGFTIENCYADAGHGGGIYIDNGSSPTIDNCVIKNNQAQQNGGGIAIEGDSSPYIINCIIHNNSVFLENNPVDGDGGGGVYISASSPVIENSTISENSVNGNKAYLIFYGGGGMLLVDDSEAVIKNCVIKGNEVQNSAGGGMAFNNSYAEINSCVIKNNHASVNPDLGYDTGGGIILMGSSPVISNSIIRDNEAYNGGGLEISYGSSPVIVNTMIVDNKSGDGGGARVTSCIGEGEDCAASEPRFIFCTFANNDANAYLSGGGGAIKIMNNESFVTILNSILWGNDPDQINTSFAAAVTVGYSDVEGGWEGDHNMDQDPKFKNSEGGDYHLTVQQSPCINKGMRLDEIDRDFEGTLRPSGRGYDLGADEAGGLVWRPGFSQLDKQDEK